MRVGLLSPLLSAQCSYTKWDSQTVKRTPAIALSNYRIKCAQSYQCQKEKKWEQNKKEENDALHSNTNPFSSIVFCISLFSLFFYCVLHFSTFTTFFFSTFLAAAELLIDTKMHFNLVKMTVKCILIHRTQINIFFFFFHSRSPCRFSQNTFGCLSPRFIEKYDIIPLNLVIISIFLNPKEKKIQIIFSDKCFGCILLNSRESDCQTLIQVVFSSAVDSVMFCGWEMSCGSEKF